MVRLRKNSAQAMLLYLDLLGFLRDASDGFSSREPLRLTVTSQSVSHLIGARNAAL